MHCLILNIPVTELLWDGHHINNELCTSYCIAGNFGELIRSSIWQKKVWRINKSADRLLIVSTNWMVLVWQITDNLPNSPNLPAIWYMAVRFMLALP